MPAQSEDEIDRREVLAAIGAAVAAGSMFGTAEPAFATRRMHVTDRLINNGGIEIATQAFGGLAQPTVLLIMGSMASMLWWPDEFCERSEEHTSELQSLMRISYAVFCMKKNTKH